MSESDNMENGMNGVEQKILEDGSVMITGEITGAAAIDLIKQIREMEKKIEKNSNPPVRRCAFCKERGCREGLVYDISFSEDGVRYNSDGNTFCSAWKDGYGCTRLRFKQIHDEDGKDAKDRIIEAIKKAHAETKERLSNKTKEVLVRDIEISNLKDRIAVLEEKIENMTDIFEVNRRRLQDMTPHVLDLNKFDPQNIDFDVKKKE